MKLRKPDGLKPVLKSAVTLLALLSAGAAGASVTHQSTPAEPNGAAAGIPVSRAEDTLPARGSASIPTGAPAVYSAAISTRSPRVLVANRSQQITLTVRNTGPDIPALSLWVAPTGAPFELEKAASDRTPHPLPVIVDNGRGWNFGPLPHDAQTRIVLTLSARKSGAGELVVRAFAIAEDEGDDEESIDSHIPSADTRLSLWVRPLSGSKKV